LNSRGDVAQNNQRQDQTCDGQSAVEPTTGEGAEHTWSGTSMVLFKHLVT